MVRIREKHLAPQHTGYSKAICSLLSSSNRGDKDKLAVRQGAEKGCSEGNTHHYNSFSLFFLFRKFDSPTAGVKDSQRVKQSFFSLVCFLCKKNLRGYIVLALLLFQSISCSFPSELPFGQWLPHFFFHRKLDGERKKQQRVFIKH